MYKIALALLVLALLVAGVVNASEMKTIYLPIAIQQQQPTPTMTPTIPPTMTGTPTPTLSPTPTPSPTKTPLSTPETPQDPPIPPGTYLVPSGIYPGIYHGVVASGLWCYWERLSDLSGEFEAIIANDIIFSGQFYVEIKTTDYAFYTTCSVMKFDPQLPSEYPNQINPGTYMITYDILPGIYQGNAGANSCYWARLRDVSGELSGIITNDFISSGQFYVQVNQTDFALETSCDLSLSE